MNAGILFYHRQYVLAGKQRRGELWNGIGGKYERGETAKYTAIRESIEEIFGVYDENFIRKVSKILFPRALSRDNNYALFAAPIQELLNISALIQKEKIFTPIYAKLPNTIDELVNNFLPNGELLGLRLIDVDHIPANTVAYFKKDIELFRRKNIGS